MHKPRHQTQTSCNQYSFRVTSVLRLLRSFAGFPSFSFLAHLPCSLDCPKPKRPAYFAYPDRIYRAMNILVYSRSLRISSQLPGAYLFLHLQKYIQRKQLFTTITFRCSSHSQLKYSLKLIVLCHLDLHLPFDFFLGISTVIRLGSGRGRLHIVGFQDPQVKGTCERQDCHGSRQRSTLTAQLPVEAKPILFLSCPKNSGAQS